MTVQTVKAVINGQEYTLTKGSGNTWSVTITAPTQTSGMNNAGTGPGVGAAASGKGYYAVTFTATDDAGNSTTIDDTHTTLGTECRLKVKETVAPVAALTYPSASATITSNKPEIAFKLTDSGSGINPSSVKLKIDSGAETAVTVTGSGTDYTGTFTPSTVLADGSHTITVYGYDYDGNKSNVATVTFKIDTTPPTLVLTTPVDATTNNMSGTITGTTNDALSSPVTVTATLNGKDVGAITVGSDGSFSKSITYTTGTNTVVVTATDAAGKSSSITRTIIVNTSAPVFTSVTITENPSTTGARVTITVEVTDE